MLEPCDAKVSCTVLRGLGDRKVARLLGSLPLHLSEMPTTRPSDFPERDFWPASMSRCLGIGSADLAATGHPLRGD